jgi:hypothetical protein
MLMKALSIGEVFKKANLLSILRILPRRQNRKTTVLLLSINTECDIHHKHSTKEIAKTERNPLYVCSQH